MSFLPTMEFALSSVRAKQQAWGLPLLFGLSLYCFLSENYATMKSHLGDKCLGLYLSGGSESNCPWVIPGGFHQPLSTQPHSRDSNVAMGTGPGQYNSGGPCLSIHTVMVSLATKKCTVTRLDLCHQSPSKEWSPRQRAAHPRSSPALQKATHSPTTVTEPGEV